MTCTANSMVKDAMRSVSVESTGAAPTDVSAAADLSRSLPRMRPVGESIYQTGSLSMHPIMAAPLLALSLAGMAVPAAAQPRDSASDGVERSEAVRVGEECVRTCRSRCAPYH